MKGGRHTRTQITPHDIGSHQADLRLLLLKQVHQHGRMRQRRVRRQPRSVEDMQFIYAVWQYLRFYLSRNARPGGHSFELHAERIG